MAFLKKLRFKLGRNKKETAETKNVAESEKIPSTTVQAEKRAVVTPQLPPVTEARDGDEAESVKIDNSTVTDKVTKGSVNGSESSLGGHAADEERDVPESSKTTKSDWDCCGVSFTIP